MPNVPRYYFFVLYKVELKLYIFANTTVIVNLVVA